MELIERETKCQKKNYLETYNKIQISFNSYGHLTVRLFKSPPEPYYENGELKVPKPLEVENDLLINFTADQTRQIIRFVKRLPENSYYDC